MTEAEGQVDVVEAPRIHVAPSPHVASGALTSRWMMLDVLLALTPAIAMSIYVFQGYAVKQLIICVGGCVGAEALLTLMRRRCPLTAVGDVSAVVTGVILALALPGLAPWYVGLVAAVVAVGLGKAIFGGLGQNIFNPAMVGRAFVMICFAKAMGYVANTAGVLDVMTSATPMEVMKKGGAFEILDLLVGNTNGSLGETSAIACVLGGLYLCVRRTASWEIPLGVLLSVGVIGGAIDLTAYLRDVSTNMTVLHHVLGGAMLFGAFFIATDPVSSPMTPKGKFIFGLGVGAMAMLIRKLSAYPEGVMFAVLLMNAVVPLINRWTIPRPVGGPVPQRK